MRIANEPCLSNSKRRLPRELRTTGVSARITRAEFQAIYSALDGDWKPIALLGRYVRLPLPICARLTSRNYCARKRMLLLPRGKVIFKIPVGPMVANALAESSRLVAPGQPLFQSCFDKPDRWLYQTFSAIAAEVLRGGNHHANHRSKLAFSSLYMRLNRRLLNEVRTK